MDIFSPLIVQVFFIVKNQEINNGDRSLQKE